MNFQPVANRVLLFLLFYCILKCLLLIPFLKKIYFFIFNFVYMCMSMNTYGYRCPWKPEREPDAFQPELQAFGSHLTQVIRTKLRSSVWAVGEYSAQWNHLFIPNILFKRMIMLSCYQSYLKIVVSSQLYFSTPLKEMAGYKQCSLVPIRRT